MQRKVFRIERMFEDRLPARPSAATARDAATRSGAPIERELALLNDSIARNTRELAALIGDGRERRMAHAAGKLGAAIEAMEKATVKILNSAEAIDDSAKALAAALKTDHERGLAQEIQDHVVKIYEACNFQDLAGQRIGHVIATLNLIEQQIANMLNRCETASHGLATAGTTTPDGLLGGPRLDGASGHTSQSDIDALFD
jgi:chemotaxis protein CheZ